MAEGLFDINIDMMKVTHYKRTIRRIEDVIGQSKDLKTALGAALNAVIEAMRAETGTIWFYDKYTDGKIKPFAVYGGGDLGGFTLELGDGIAGRCVERGVSEIVEDCQRDVRWQGKVDKKTGFITKSMIVVPMNISDQTFGCIQIINKVRDDFFDTNDLTFAEDLSKAASPMFSRFGMKGYEIDEIVSKLSFVDLVHAKDLKTLEKNLKTYDEFAGLGIRDQEKILSNMGEIHAIFNKTKRF